MDIGKISIYLISILLVSYFLYQPTHAHIHIHVLPYKPNIIYLGRHNRFEDESFPSPPEDPVGKNIYAVVHDIYGKIVYGNLSYTIDGEKRKWTGMTLIYGSHANGTWMGLIPIQEGKIPYTVHYNANFTDDLHYHAAKDGPYYNPLNYSGTDENILEGKGYNVTDRYIEDSSLFNQTLPNKYFFRACAMISDYRKNALHDNTYNVTLHYQLINSRKTIPWNTTPYVYIPKSYKVENKSHVIIHKFYSANIPITPGIKKIVFYSTLHDSSQPDVNSTQHPKIQYLAKVSTQNQNDILVKTKVMNTDVDDKTARMKITLNGSLIYTNYLAESEREERTRNIGIPENIRLELIDNGTNTARIPASFHNLTQIISPINFSSFHATINYPASLTGDASSFPLDHYNLNLTIEVPINNVKMDRANPDPPPSPWIFKNPPSITQRENVLNIHMELSRSDFFLWTIIFPILFVFFLLGFICLLPTKDHYLVARVTITLGVFAFVFAFESILHDMKPASVQNVSTFADFLLNLVLVAAIASTISSVIGSLMDRFKYRPKWMNFIYQYRIHDFLAVALVLIISIWIYDYYQPKPHFVDFHGNIIMIIIGCELGLILPFKMMFKFRSKQRKQKNIETISSKSYDLKKEGVSQADLWNAIWALNDNKTHPSWTRLRVDGGKVKVEILHIKEGKFIIVDDKEGGKYVGKIVDTLHLILFPDNAKEKL